MGAVLHRCPVTTGTPFYALHTRHFPPLLATLLLLFCAHLYLLQALSLGLEHERVHEPGEEEVHGEEREPGVHAQCVQDGREYDGDHQLAPPLDGGQERHATARARSGYTSTPTTSGTEAYLQHACV